MKRPYSAPLFRKHRLPAVWQQLADAADLQPSRGLRLGEDLADSEGAARVGIPARMAC